ncbi:MAG: sulfur carrier protein ThiS [Planctomycetes bacterium]|nr:sulfur carrier protein ThiS [Planctomycetota bacterium]
MKIIVNGEEREIAPGTTLEQLLLLLGLDRGSVAIEVNGALVSRSRYAERALQPEERLEIVTFVGGG